MIHKEYIYEGIYYFRDTIELYVQSNRYLNTIWYLKKNHIKYIKSENNKYRGVLRLNCSSVL
jgi:hypothetical protein